jgi:hypothetical protein
MRILSFAAAAVLIAWGAPSFAAEPIVSLWYRGLPAGVPRFDDLAAIRAAGFSAVTWPTAQAAALGDLSRLADRAGLFVVLQPDVPGFDLPGRRTLQVSEDRARQVPALAWRALADGVHTISFDPGHDSGTGLHRADGLLAGWVAFAAAFSRQVSANRELFAGLEAAPQPRVLSAAPPGFSVALRQTTRAWVLIATNVASSAAHADVQLPAGVPYAIWVSLTDGTTVGMLDRPGGARWTATLAPGDAAVYVIDKVPTGAGSGPKAQRMICSSGTTSTGPNFASRIGCSIVFKSPTTTTANVSVGRYCFAARSTSAAETAWIFPTYSSKNVSGRL